MKPIHDDVFGLTPEFKIEGDNPFNKHVDGRHLNKVGQTFTLIKVQSKFKSNSFV